MTKKRRATYYLPTCEVCIVPRTWLRQKPWYRRYANKLCNFVDSANGIEERIIYTSPDLFGLYFREANKIYLVEECSTEQKELNFNKLLAMHSLDTGYSTGDFYSLMTNNDEYSALIKHIREKKLK